MFCPKCGSILMPKKANGKKIMSCSCGYTDAKAAETTLSEKSKNDQPEIAVIDKEYSADVLVDMECEKCKHGKAYFWTVQTRASDEPETKFYKCEKCGHTVRDYL